MEEALPKQSEGEMDQDQEQTKCKTILVVDDYCDARELLKSYLSDFGYKVLEATNGVEAVTQASLNRPDLIIMDISMPVLDGLAAVREIRRDEMLRDTPVIIMTAYGARGINLYVANTDLLNENTEYIPKPIDTDILKDTLNRLVPLD